MKIEVRLLILGILFLLYHVQPLLGWTAMSALYVADTFIRRVPQRTWARARPLRVDQKRG